MIQGSGSRSRFVKHGIISSIHPEKEAQRYQEGRSALPCCDSNKAVSVMTYNGYSARAEFSADDEILAAPLLASVMCLAFTKRLMIILRPAPSSAKNRIGRSRRALHAAHHAPNAQGRCSGRANAGRGTAFERAHLASQSGKLPLPADHSPHLPSPLISKGSHQGSENFSRFTGEAKNPLVLAA